MVTELTGECAKECVE